LKQRTWPLPRALAGAGVNLIAGANNPSAELDELVCTGPVQSVTVDLAEPAGPGELAAVAGDRINILMNNVGSAPTRTGGFLSTDEDWDASITLNLMAAVRTTRAALPVMLDADQGAIVDICSANARLPDPAVMDYNAAKAAMASISKALSKEVGPKGIRVAWRFRSAASARTACRSARSWSCIICRIVCSFVRS
jgi:NAD(P)-dependent dehydrogenase (short-subunit alcohol dehydrogenase family)